MPGVCMMIIQSVGKSLEDILPVRKAHNFCLLDEALKKSLKLMGTFTRLLTFLRVPFPHFPLVDCLRRSSL